MQRQSVCLMADGPGVYMEGQSMKISSYGGKRKITCLLVLALASQLAVSCGAKDGEVMTQAMEQVKASETEPRAEESDWERGGMMIYQWWQDTRRLNLPRETRTSP